MWEMDNNDKNILIDNHVIYIYRQYSILVKKNNIPQYSWNTAKVDVKHQSINHEY